ncbi:MAG: hypothetical protein FJ290_14300 [Planctomycetes bacterium]|nr:hypothetical protein [Planctomycetota bacterium]
MRGKALRPGAAVLVAASLIAAFGCSPHTPLGRVYVYVHDRVLDAADMLDLGVSITPKFSFSVYACLLGLGGVGYGSVDGYFGGIGGSRIGIFRHYHSNIGLGIYAYEVTGWGDFDLKDRDTLTRRHRGPLTWPDYVLDPLFGVHIFPAGPGQCVGPG